MTAPRTATGRARRAPPPLAPDPAAAGAFLDQWAGLTGVPHVTLVRIIPDPRTAAKGRAFRWPADRDEALRWIVANNASSNIYFSVNTARLVHKKPLKKDILALNAVHADVDPQGGTDLGDERERLINLAEELAARDRPPSFVLDSGGGIQVFYVAAASCPAEPVEYVHEIESYSGRLHCVLGTDPCTRNVDRIMRVPGTVNWPDRRKRDRGRVPTMASLLHASSRTCPWREIVDEIALLEDEPPEHAAAPFEPRRRFDGHGAVLEGMPPYPTDDQLKALFENHPEVAAIWDQSTSWPPLDGSPNGWDFRFCSELAWIGFEPDLIGSFLRSYRRHHAPEKGKHDREDYVMRTVEAATARHREEPEPEDDGPPFEAKPNGGRQQTAGDAKGRNRGTFHTGAKPGAADWPEPGVLGEPPPAPRFPTELLPGMLRHWIELQATNMAVPPELIAIPALVCIGGALGKNAIIKPKVHDPSWLERPCLWGPIIMPKGQTKSAALIEAAAPLNRAEARQRARWKPLHDAWKVRQAERKKAQKQLGTAGSPDPEPIRPKLILDDTSIEAAGRSMVESRGLTLVKDELSSWVLNMSRYNAGNDRGFWLTCHSGGVGRVDRIGRGDWIIPDMFCAITGCIQPTVARRVIAPALEHLDDGFFERFGLLAYPDPVPWPGIVDVPPERDYRHIVAEAVDRLADTDFSRDEPLRFDATAQPEWYSWYDHHMRTRVRGLAAVGQPTHGFMTKAAGLVLRLCIVIHWFRWTCADGVFEHNRLAVDTRTLAAVLGIFETFCVPTYARVLAAFGAVDAHDAARRVLDDLIKRKKLDRVRVADIGKQNWSGMRERKPILAALEALEDVDILRRVTAAPGRVGRPSDHWIVNPKVHA